MALTSLIWERGYLCRLSFISTDDKASIQTW